MTTVIVKVPLKRQAIVEEPFPSTLSVQMDNDQTLFLDYLENREKIKKGCLVESDARLRRWTKNEDVLSPDAWSGDPVDDEVSEVTTAKKKVHVPSARTLQDQEDEEDQKRELLFRFEILRKSYPNTPIPEFTIHNDYATMKKQYDFILRKVHLDTNVDSYKSYLIGGFMVIEFIFSKLGLDMSGFCQQQMFAMSKYEKLLIELGEKSYVPKSSWPVEIRLIGLILFNALLFGFSKLIMKKTGANILNVMNNFTKPSAQTAAPQTKRMNGPDK